MRRYSHLPFVLLHFKDLNREGRCHLGCDLDSVFDEGDIDNPRAWSYCAIFQTSNRRWALEYERSKKDETLFILTNRHRRN